MVGKKNEEAKTLHDLMPLLLLLTVTLKMHAICNCACDAPVDLQLVRLANCIADLGDDKWHFVTTTKNLS